MDGFDPLAEGKELVELLTEFGDIQRVRTLLERLLSVEPNDPDLKKALVNVHVRAGDQKRVVQLYESIADDLVHENKPLEAVSYLQKILLLDRTRTDISERVRSLYEFDERARRRSRALSVLAILFCLLIVLGSGYWFYNERAEEDFRAIDVQDLVLHEDFAGAKAAFAAFIDKHPLATSISKAKAELQKIESAQELFEARRRSERAARDAALEKIRKEYREEWGRHREQFLAGHPEEAFRSVTEVRKLLSQAGAPDDMAWALEQHVERTWKHLSEFLEESEKLGRRYDEKIAAQDWAAAREVALLLQSDFETTESGRRGARSGCRGDAARRGDPDARGASRCCAPSTARVSRCRTPGLVLCQADQPVRLTAELDGFVPRKIIVNGKDDSRVEAVLEVLPKRTIAFDTPNQTGAGVGGGWLAVGLRGGKVGIARLDGSNRQIRELGGLKAVESDPVIDSGRIFFLSNEMTVECLPLDPSIGSKGWPATLTSEAATPLVPVMVGSCWATGSGVMHCWEQSTGRRLWGAALASSPSGAPTIDRRKVYVGTQDGRVLVFNVTDGKSLGVLRSPAGLTTPIHVEGNAMFFGCSDGAVRAVDFGAGKVLWTESIGRTPIPGSLALGEDTLLVAAEGKLIAFDRLSGKKRGEFATNDLVQGIGVQGTRAYVRLRRAKTRTLPVRDVLFAVEASNAAVVWEFALAGVGPGDIGLGHDSGTVALPLPGGEVVLFQ